ncbi:hypothetical protein BDZ85DRAFT_16507 [Elsinoe ampelina]|uniref:Uncharacterized protein n=1 Tax=Elsinoe ampelina TaxID=302913 RepID=A0A6A6G6K9_9PEZI|nr:hypothetical protein BDZ85DRAFT_16507 [Elsinoe ampelina]
MTSYANIMARDADGSIFDNPTMSKLLIALLVLVLVGLLISLALLYIRHQKKKREQRQSLPQYERPMSSRSNHRRLAIRPESSYVYQEKQAFLASSDAPPPASPVPEIRITLPEDYDKSGRPQSGRVVVVHVGDTSVGFAPYEEKLPTYQQNESDRFQSLDLDRIGGLKEKEYR